LLLIGDQRIETKTLTLPHPHISQRAFVLYPLVALAPDLVLADTGASAKEALGNLHSTLRVTRIPWSMA
jgi:2-amino-4-hydroxy-6-hydroxymethyldihydropteridine diphosphokinase